jgi:spore maturation protein CgeB
VIAKIDFFTAMNQYSSTIHFTRGFKEALEMQGVACRMFDLEDGYFRESMQMIFEDPPDLTLSFNYLGFEEEQIWLCDALNVPHLTYGLDATLYGVNSLNNPLMALSTVDRMDWEGFQSFGGSRMLFLPHAVEEGFAGLPHLEDRPYDLVFCGTYIDYIEEEESWPLKFSESVCKMMKMASQRILNDPSSSVFMAIAKAREALQTDLTGVDFQKVYDAVERYCKGWDRFALINSLRDFNVHLFGSHTGRRDWRRCFADAPNVVFHAPVSFTESLDIFKKSKIVINSAPQFRHGSHERVFYGLAAGCAVITNDNPYLEGQFGQGKGLLYYLPGRENELKEQVKELLANNVQRKDRIATSRQQVMEHHTWRQRVDDLQDQWSKIDFAHDK